MSNSGKTFEDNIKRLEEIVRIMERGDAPLEDSLKLFQEGTQLVQSCGKLLDDAEMEIRKIVPDEEGRPKEEDFTHVEDI